jgi:acetolactate synthase I/II/III large subunit
MIWIDGSYDMVAAQEQIKYNRTSGITLGPSTYVKYAEAFGATGFQIQHPDEIAPTLHKAFDTPGPVLDRSACRLSRQREALRRCHEAAFCDLAIVR